ncbi:MAG: VOC family protein [Verrucomicrobiota bacterium]
MEDVRNPVGWFEIYVSDLERGKRFYEAVFETTLELLESPVDGIEMWMFPGGPHLAGVSGAIVKMEGVEPGIGGTLVYFSCEDCATEAGRVEAAGGKVLQPKFSIGDYGEICMVADPDGNMIGLHNPAESE